MEHYLKKIKYLAIAYLFVPLWAFAAPIIEDDTGGMITEGSQVAKFILRVQNFVIGLAGFAILAMIIYAGFLYITSGGNEERVGNAKKTLTAAIVGLIIVVCAYAIINALVWAVGGSI
uniref:Uncharacterized protein n=1 Tax=candidate division WWE3 bacterium TaxID=2053526 RepID=A0A7C4TPP4_UNCKA